MYLDYPLYKPFLRAHMERECSQICTGISHYQEVVDSCIAEMRQVFCDVEMMTLSVIVDITSKRAIQEYVYSIHSQGHS